MIKRSLKIKIFNEGIEMYVSSIVDLQDRVVKYRVFTGVSPPSIPRNKVLGTLLV
jgi:hypothetical protein